VVETTLTLRTSPALLAGSVTLEIGPDHLKYSVPKALLVYHSEYFRNALKESWKEGQENLIVLDDVDPVPGDFPFCACVNCRS